MNSFSSLSPLRLRVLGIALFALSILLLSLSVTAHAQTQIQTPPQTYQKVRSAAPPFYGKRMEIKVTTPNLIAIRENKPGKKEIDAEASIALRVVGTGEDAILRPFWFGQADFTSSATKFLPPYGSRVDIYDPQKYLWTVSPAPTIPVVPPVEQSPAMVLADIALEEINPTFYSVLYPWESLPSWAKTPLKLAAQEAIGLEETAADGRPLGQLKPGISRRDKHFYWDFGTSPDQFPQTTLAKVVFAADNAPDAIGPAEAKINWRKPTRTVYDVEVGLWNWVDEEEADAATLEEWTSKLLEDEELQREILIDTAIEVVSMAAPGAGKVAASGGKIVFRIVLKNKAPARAVSKAVEKVVLRATKRPSFRPDGTQLPTPTWHKTHKIRTGVKDGVRRGEPRPVDILKKAGEEAAEEVTEEGAEQVAEEVAKKNDPEKFWGHNT